MDEVLRFHVLGTPVPQGSKKISKRGKFAQIIDDNAVELTAWRATIALAAYTAREAQHHATMSGPVSVRGTFVFPRIKSARRTDFWKVTKPDTDKLERALLDAMTDAGVYGDDGQVCDAWFKKRMGLPDAENDPPGIYVTVGIPANPLLPRPEPAQVPLPIDSAAT